MKTSKAKSPQTKSCMFYIQKLYDLSSALRRPCLRLRILQSVLGLDTRFSRDVVHGVICLAFDVLEEMGAAKAPRRDGGVEETTPPPQSSSHLGSPAYAPASV